MQESPSGRRKALATSSINMKQYASPMPTQTDVKLKFKPLSKKVVSATLQFSLSCIFLREGKATYVQPLTFFFLKFLLIRRPAASAAA